jgi:hypothetical protein
MKKESRKQNLVEAFQSAKVLDLGTIKGILSTTSRMTVFRQLKELGYYSSYSHSGKYYTLGSIPVFDKNGLWSYVGIHFSRRGSLMDTIPVLVNRSQAGYFASELEELLHVFVHNALGKLFVLGRLLREQIGDQYLYLSAVLAESQFLARKKMLTQGAEESISITNLTGTEMIEHLKTFLSVLNEKQRRLYLGLESIKLGHGGDVRMASVAGINVKTVSRGRKELLSKEIDRDRVRRKGAGRPPLKKTKS